MYEDYNNLEEFTRFSIAGWTYATEEERDIINKAVDNAREYAAGSALMVDLLDRFTGENFLVLSEDEIEASHDLLDGFGKEFNDVFMVLSIYGLEG